MAIGLVISNVAVVDIDKSTKTPASPLGRVSIDRVKSASRASAVLYNRNRSPLIFDCIANNINLPELDIGDYIYAENMGAYTVSCATNFNGFTPAKVKYILY